MVPQADWTRTRAEDGDPMQNEHASTSPRDAELGQSRIVPSELFGLQTIGIGSMEATP